MVNWVIVEGMTRHKLRPRRLWQQKQQREVEELLRPPCLRFNPFLYEFFLCREIDVVVDAVDEDV